MERTIKIDKTYRHFKGHLYKIIGIAFDSETLKKVIVYQNLDDDMLWVRDYDMFNSLVDKEKYPNILQKYRFEEID